MGLSRDYEKGKSGTMGDLIDRQAAIEALKRAEALARAFGYHVVLETVRELPSAEPERKKGKWIEVNDFYNRIRGRCSVCGWDAHILKVMVRTEVEIVGN